MSLWLCCNSHTWMSACCNVSKPEKLSLLYQEKKGEKVKTSLPNSCTPPKASPLSLSSPFIIFLLLSHYPAFHCHPLPERESTCKVRSKLEEVQTCLMGCLDCREKGKERRIIALDMDVIKEEQRAVFKRSESSIKWKKNNILIKCQ